MTVSLWHCYERTLSSTRPYTNPLQEAQLSAEFESPSGKQYRIWGFWDGDNTWRFRFMPDEEGAWSFVTTCSDEQNSGLHRRTGQFVCQATTSQHRFTRHGKIQLSRNRRYLQHADGTPFFWMADTAWNGPLFSTDSEWMLYLTRRVEQRFSAIQWVATEWISAPDGDRDHQRGYSGHETIVVNPTFFQRLDHKLQQINETGLLGVPVLLWAAEWGDPDIMKANPGLSLPEDQAILLARYMVARWQSFHVAWILGGDGVYLGEKADRWKRIGRAVFGEIAHAPVMMHPAGMQWHRAELGNENWLDVLAYQSCHFGHEDALAWLTEGPPASDWQHDPAHPIINLEPPYENHQDISGTERFQADRVRRAMYWSLLNAPTAGVSYGGHGVWGWDDGTTPPVAHPNTGIPLPWSNALSMPGAEQIPHLVGLFSSFDWWNLEPVRDVLLVQPGKEDRAYYILAAATQNKDVWVIYTPVCSEIKLNRQALPGDARSFWFDPRTGQTLPASSLDQPTEGRVFIPPAPGDWVLLIYPKNETLASSSSG